MYTTGYQYNRPFIKYENSGFQQYNFPNSDYLFHQIGYFVYYKNPIALIIAPFKKPIQLLSFLINTVS